MNKLLPLVLLLGCSTLKPLPGDLTNLDGLAEAQEIVWRDAYHRQDAPPKIYIVQGHQLSCTDPNSSKPGFDCPGTGCREGCTGSPFGVHVSYTGGPWSETTLAHEDMHALLMRDALPTLLEAPKTVEGYMSIGDGKHKGPEWQPGGLVDQANRMLQERGR